ncbi:2-oxoglutarate and iron-dependent oxygenase domain-containing protein 3 [Manduca sexta]|uniref:2-oxoglutarate and iron-dependent oxygenase domain-containing protein 3 n=1 Tax=Manduca sexta TaxID=7130 RepID=UPI00188FF277|nr:2-oxoglutarate and iron-dependent oxygenase domain-containing protein 3 [Manduca sexta]
MAEIMNRKGREKNKNITKSDTSEEIEDVKVDAKDKSYVNKNLPLRILTRVVVTTSLLIVVYYTTQTQKVQPFAKQSDLLLDGKVRIVECSSEYIEEVDKFQGCVPNRCKRVVNDKVITEEEAAVLLDIAKMGLQFGGSSGGASILDLHSGALSHGNHFINIYKNKDAKKLFNSFHFEIYRIVKEKVKFAVAYYFQVHPEKIYLTHPTFFSELTAKEAVTVHDEYWHPHVDKETYSSFHFTTLLYLNDFGVDFEGGRFVFIDNAVNRTIEPRKARVSMFTSGKENYHFVEKVTKGVRYAMTISFTCDIQYAIREPDLKKFLN